MGKCSKRRTMNGKWVPGDGRNMYTTGTVKGLPKGSCCHELFKYEKLHKLALDKINSEFALFMDDQTDNLSTDMYKELGLTLVDNNVFTTDIYQMNNCKYDTTTFQNFKYTTHNLLNYLQKITLEYKKHQICLGKLEQQQNLTEILHDADKLNEWIKNHFGVTNLSQAFGVEVNTSVAPELHPAYREYFKIWGWPKDFIFDSERLAYICRYILGIAVI